MDSTQVVSKLTGLVRRAFGDDKIEFSPNLTAADIPGWTSLSFMKLLEGVEQEFSFRFKVMELISIRSLGDLAGVIEKHCK